MSLYSGGNRQSVQPSPTVNDIIMLCVLSGHTGVWGEVKGVYV